MKGLRIHIKAKRGLYTVKKVNKNKLLRIDCSIHLCTKQLDFIVTPDNFKAFEGTINTLISDNFRTALEIIGILPKSGREKAVNQLITLMKKYKMKLGGKGEKLTDHSMMPYGKYGPDEGDPRKMANVPASYLLWLRENGKTNPAVLVYIKENLDVLLKEVNEGHFI